MKAQTDKKESMSIEILSKDFPKYDGKKEEIETAIRVLEKIASRIATTNKSNTDVQEEYISAQGLENSAEGKKIADSLRTLAKNKDDKEKKILLGNHPRASTSVRTSLLNSVKFLRNIKQ